MYKKKIAMLLFLVFLLPILSACGPKDQNPENTTNPGYESGESTESSQPAETTAEANSSPSVTTVPGASTDPGLSTKSTTTVSTTAPTTTATTPETTSDVVRISIPEGYTLAKICLLLESKGVNTFDKLFSYATTQEFSQYSFLPAASSTPNRCFRLEGYLYPDTYDFYLDEKPESVWKKFLDNFQRRSATLANEASNGGLTLDQALTIASIIEKESDVSQRANISAVIRNRLAQNMVLAMDSTYTYYRYIIQEYSQQYAATDPTTFRNFYYTYEHQGLPAGPICNPGSEAITAAANPSDIQSLYFFTVTVNGAISFVYSDTLEEHEQKAIEAGVITPTPTAGG